jgi:hypothetical protein
MFLSLLLTTFMGFAIEVSDFEFSDPTINFQEIKISTTTSYKGSLFNIYSDNKREWQEASLATLERKLSNFLTPEMKRLLPCKIVLASLHTTKYSIGALYSEEITQENDQCIIFIEEKFSNGKIRSLITHEFFHFLQSRYHSLLPYFVFEGASIFFERLMGTRQHYAPNIRKLLETPLPTFESNILPLGEEKEFNDILSSYFFEFLYYRSGIDPVKFIIGSMQDPFSYELESNYEKFTLNLSKSILQNNYEKLDSSSLNCPQSILQSSYQKVLKMSDLQLECQNATTYLIMTSHLNSVKVLKLPITDGKFRNIPKGIILSIRSR